MTIDRFVDLLDRARHDGNGQYTACCPAHNDTNPSLRVKEGKNGGVVVRCMAGCETKDVCASLGLTEKDLFDLDHSSLETAVYFYHDADGSELYQKHRLPPKKFFWMHRPLGGDLVKGQGDRPPVLYQLPELLVDIAKGREILIVEGEKDVDLLRRHGFAATCGPHGVAKWNGEMVSLLTGAQVCILPDEDRPGHKYAQYVAESVSRVARSVQILSLPGLGASEDVSDWLPRNSPEALESLLAQAAVLSEVEEPSSIPRGGLDERKLRIRTAHQLCRTSVQRPDYLVEPYFVKGMVTAISGKIKESGKTTLLLALIRSVLRGEDYLEMPAEQGSVLLLSEQTDASLAHMLRKAGLENESNLHVLSFSDLFPFSWEEIMRYATGVAEEMGAVFLAIDTLHDVARIRDENSASEAGRVMAYVKRAAATGLCVVVTSHERKSGGTVVDASRGSSAYLGQVDMILSLSRPAAGHGSNVREIRSVGRFDTPESLVVRLDEDGHYRRVEHDPESAFSTLDSSVLSLVPVGRVDAISRGDIERLLPPHIAHSKLDVSLPRLEKSAALDSIRGPGRGGAKLYWRPEAELSFGDHILRVGGKFKRFDSPVLEDRPAAQLSAAGLEEVLTELGGPTRVYKLASDDVCGGASS